MTRRFTAYIAVTLLFGLLAYDITVSPPDPFAAPSAFALGSSEPSSGGFCGTLPTK